MSQQQRTALDALLRDAPLDLGGDVAEQRAVFESMIGQMPRPEGVDVQPREIGGVDTLWLHRPGSAAGHTILYVHGGAFAIGTAASSVPLAGDLARRAELDLVTVDYRLAPEAPFPAALDDVLDVWHGLVDTGHSPERIVFAGESAGAGLVMSALLSLRDAGVAVPRAALLMSPWADLTFSGDTARSKQAVDPAVAVAGLDNRVQDYVGRADVRDPLVSPVFGDLSGLPPLLIQVGSHEVLLSDAVRLAAAAGAADVDVTLEVVAGVPHVFQSFAGMLDEGAAALDRGARFLRERLEVGTGE